MRNIANLNTRQTWNNAESDSSSSSPDLTSGESVSSKQSNERSSEDEKKDEFHSAPLSGNVLKIVEAAEALDFSASPWITMNSEKNIEVLK